MLKESFLTLICIGDSSPDQTRAAACMILKNSLVEVAGPEVIVLHNEGHNAGLQLCHERILRNDTVDVRLPGCQVKGVQPGLHVTCYDDPMALYANQTKQFSTASLIEESRGSEQELAWPKT